jgi:hypothetical protein
LGELAETTFLLRRHTGQNLYRGFESLTLRQTNVNMSLRTIHTFGTTNGNTAATIKVNDQIVHSGPLESGMLFEFVTSVTLHGSVVVSIDMLYGSLTITHNRATYPALINEQVGFVNMPQPIVQPNLPLTVTDSAKYNHYIFNGPNRWLIKVDSPTRFVVIDDFYNAFTTSFIKEDFQYAPHIVDVNKLNDISGLM